MPPADRTPSALDGPPPDGLCGIPASGGAIGYAPCDLPWGHDGDMHANGGDGFYSRHTEEEHRRRQIIVFDKRRFGL